MSNREIGKRAALLREPMSQVAVANAMRTRGFSWSQSAVWKMEAGERPLRLTEAIALADVIGVTLHDIAGIETEQSALISENNELRKRIGAALEALDTRTGE